MKPKHGFVGPEAMQWETVCAARDAEAGWLTQHAFTKNGYYRLRTNVPDDYKVYCWVDFYSEVGPADLRTGEVTLFPERDCEGPTGQVAVTLPPSWRTGARVWEGGVVVNGGPDNPTIDPTNAHIAVQLWDSKYIPPLTRGEGRTAAVVERVGEELGWSFRERLHKLCLFTDEADLIVGSVESFDERDAILEAWLRK